MTVPSLAAGKRCSTEPRGRLQSSPAQCNDGRRAWCGSLRTAPRTWIRHSMRDAPSLAREVDAGLQATHFSRAAAGVPPHPRHIANIQCRQSARPRMQKRADLLAAVCDLLDRGRMEDARRSLADYAPAGVTTPRAAWPMARLIRVFQRDGFTDRYSGDRLVFPGTLRALSVLLPDVFPYHRNWKQSATHPAYWELYPTIDHVVPVVRGGLDDESNVVTTSMLRNAAKANWLLEELGWPQAPVPVVAGWDGLLGWFVSVSGSKDALRNDPAIVRWRRAAIDARPGPTSAT